MTEVRIAVARSPNSAQPAQSTASARHELSRLLVERGQQMLERRVEAGDTLGFEGPADIVHIHAQRGQPRNVFTVSGPMRPST